MAPFALCPACAREYHDPADRRFHAQPNACAACGPTVAFRSGAARGDRARRRGDPRGDRAAARSGGILALKGLGGYQLACNALDAAAVATLRERKRRSNKAFALMAPDVAAVRAFAAVSAEEEALLLSPERPIVLLARAAGAGLPDAVAPAVGRTRVHAPEHAAALAAVSRGALPQQSRRLAAPAGRFSTRRNAGVRCRRTSPCSS